MARTEKETGLGMLITSVKAQLIHVQSLEIMLDGFVQDISKAQDGGEFCEILEEIANGYLNLAEKIERCRLVNPTIVGSVRLAEACQRPRAEILI